MGFNSGFKGLKYFFFKVNIYTFLVMILCLEAFLRN